MSAPDTAPDLDLRPYLPERFRITGATGREYVVSDWMPMTILVRVEQMVDFLKDVDPLKLRSTPEQYEYTLEDARDLTLEILQHYYPDLTKEDVGADYPAEASVTFLGFLLRRWLAGRAARMGALTTTEKAEAETPKPRPISESEIQRALTGSKSLPTSSSEVTDQ